MLIEHYFESSIQLNFNYRNGLAGTLKYLFELNKITKDPINILEKIIKTLLNKKVLLSPQFKSIEDSIDVIDVLINNSYIYDDNVLECLNIFINNLKNDIEYKQLNLKEIIKAIDLIKKLYQKDKLYKYKLILESLKDLLEFEILKIGLNSFNEMSDISPAKLLSTINDLYDINITSMKNDFKAELNLINSNIISKLYKNDSDLIYDFNQLKNIFLFLNCNLINKNIEFLKLKKIL